MAFYGGGIEIRVSGNTAFSLIFTSAGAVFNALPTCCSPYSLTKDEVDPSSTTSGLFGGSVLALQFNVDFSDAGYLTGSSGTLFGDLVLVDAPFTRQFNGLTFLRSTGVLAMLGIALAGWTQLLSGRPEPTVQGNTTARSALMLAALSSCRIGTRSGQRWTGAFRSVRDGVSEHLPSGPVCCLRTTTFTAKINALLDWPGTCMGECVQPCSALGLTGVRGSGREIRWVVRTGVLPVVCVCAAWTTGSVPPTKRAAICVVHF